MHLMYIHFILEWSCGKKEIIIETGLALMIKGGMLQNLWEYAFQTCISYKQTTIKDS